MDPAAVAVAHETSMPEHRRRRLGVWATPPALVAHVLDEVLGPLLAADDARLPSVADPACGTGLFLVEVVRRLAAASGRTRRAVAEEAVVGVDVDPAAVRRARDVLWDDAVGQGSPPPGWLDGRLRVADALATDWGEERFDAVVGNPPYLTPLASATAPAAERAVALRTRFGAAVGAYTDAAALFALLAAELTRPGGRFGLVLPQSVLSTRDARAVRHALLRQADLASVWVAGEAVFDAAVLTCAPTFVRRADREAQAGARAPRLRRWRGPAFTRLTDTAVDRHDLAARPTWSHLVADGFGVPELGPMPTGSGCLAQEAGARAGFRDQYYGLAPYVVEDDGGHEHPARLVTTGLIDPARCWWSERPATYHRRRWARPAVDVGALPPGGPLARWVELLAVPKVLVATQTRVLEAVADPGGRWVPSVPVLAVIPHDPTRLWHVAAALSSPLASAWAAGTYLGAARSTRGLKLGPREVEQIPTPPPDHPGWDEAAHATQAAHLAPDEPARRAALEHAARAMVAASGLDVDASQGEALLAWWRAGLRGPTRGPISAG